jgi:hypothetical protein
MCWIWSCDASWTSACFILWFSALRFVLKSFTNFFLHSRKLHGTKSFLDASTLTRSTSHSGIYVVWTKLFNSYSIVLSLFYLSHVANGCSEYTYNCHRSRQPREARDIRQSILWRWIMNARAAFYAIRVCKLVYLCFFKRNSWRICNANIFLLSWVCVHLYGWTYVKYL